jgi:hypothetical protein
LFFWLVEICCYTLYAMPRHLRIGQTAGEVRKGGGLLELSEGEVLVLDELVAQSQLVMHCWVKLF